MPPQGGLPPAGGAGGAVVEVACDESGFSGTNLPDAPALVFTHASADLRAGEAVEPLGALRSGFGQSPGEFKSGRFLRGPRAGEALEWLLAALSGRAHVHVIDKLPASLSPLAGLVTVDSRDDPRVQIADLLAGAALRSPDIGDNRQLQPFLSPASLRDPER